MLVWGAAFRNVINSARFYAGMATDLPTHCPHCKKVMLGEVRSFCAHCNEILEECDSRWCSTVDRGRSTLKFM
jgi:hypothetical protein